MRSSAGSIKKVDKDRWRVTVSKGRDANGKRVRISKQIRGSKRDAELLRARMLTDDGTLEKPRTLADVTREYLEVKREAVRPDTLTGYKQNAKKILTSTLANIPVAEMEQKEAEVRQWLKAEKSDGARRNAHKIMRQVLNYAVRQRYITYNVMEYIDEPRLEVKDKQTVTLEMLPRYLEAIRGAKCEAGILVMLGCGLRRSEAFGLRWDDIEWREDGAKFEVKRGCYKKEGGGVYFDAPKTRKSRREIMLPDWVQKRLKEIKGEGFICTGSETPPTERSVTLEWQKRLRDADLPYIQLRNLRHSCGTMLVRELGANITDVQQLLGHTSTKITETYYVQKSDVAERRVASLWDVCQSVPNATK